MSLIIASDSRMTIDEKHHNFSWDTVHCTHNVAHKVDCFGGPAIASSADYHVVGFCAIGDDLVVQRIASSVDDLKSLLNSQQLGSETVLRSSDSLVIVTMILPKPHSISTIVYTLLLWVGAVSVNVNVPYCLSSAHFDCTGLKMGNAQVYIVDWMGVIWAFVYRLLFVQLR